MDTLTSLLAGSCIFMFLGYLQHINKGNEHYSLDVQINHSGAGMAFIVFPSVVFSIFGDGWAQVDNRI